MVAKKEGAGEERRLGKKGLAVWDCLVVVSDSSAIPWIVVPQAPLSMGFPRHEYWSRLPFPSPGDLPEPGIKPVSPAWQADSLPMSYLGSLLSGTPVPHQWHTACRTVIGKLWGSKYSFPKSGQGLFNNYIFILTY